MEDVVDRVECFLLNAWEVEPRSEGRWAAFAFGTGHRSFGTQGPIRLDGNG